MHLYFKHTFLLIFWNKITCLPNFIYLKFIIPSRQRRLSTRHLRCCDIVQISETRLERLTTSKYNQHVSSSITFSERLVVWCNLIKTIFFIRTLLECIEVNNKKIACPKHFIKAYYKNHIINFIKLCYHRLIYTSNDEKYHA